MAPLRTEIKNGDQHQRGAGNVVGTLQMESAPRLAAELGDVVLGTRVSQTVAAKANLRLIHCARLAQLSQIKEQYQSAEYVEVGSHKKVNSHHMRTRTPAHTRESKKYLNKRLKVLPSALDRCLLCEGGCRRPLSQTPTRACIY